MSDYTPSTEPYVPTVDEMRAAAESDNPYGSMEPDEFDRGIAKVKADALREAAGSPDIKDNLVWVEWWLSDRADRIESGDGQ